MRKVWLSCLVVLLAVVAVGAGAMAQTAPAPVPPAGPLRVAVHVSPPFVTPTTTGYTGYAIELWENVATALNLRFNYKRYDTVPELLQSLVSGQSDIVVTNLTITHGRLRQMDFTQPWFDSGLRVMVREARGTGTHELLSTLHDAGHVRVYLWIGGLVILATLLLTLFDRKFDPEFPREWSHGLADSFYHVLSVVTSGRTSHRELWGAVGRAVAAIWMVVGVAVVAYITSSITSVMTMNSLTSQINSVSDLSGKAVGVLRGSTAETFCRELGLAVVPFDDLATGVELLVDKRLSGIVGDAPVLEFFDASHPKLPIKEVGSIFHPEKYGFAVAVGSPLARIVNQQILAELEAGTLRRLRLKYFGDSP